MQYKRIHVRVPISGEAVLSSSKGICLKAQAINISPGGLAVNSQTDQLDQTKYQISVTTTDGDTIELVAKPIRQDNEIIGFQTLEVGPESLTIINELVEEYQTTTDFIEQLDRHNLFDQNFTDEEGNELEVTFDIDDV